MMKKSLIFISILFLFMIPLISAVEVEMKTNFSQGETLMAKVSGNFLEPILKENIFFYRRHMRTSLIPEVTEINDEFYIYSPILKKEEVIPDNYSIVIKNVKYFKGSQVIGEDIVKNFSIIDNTADFSINPGFVVTQDNFFIDVQNLQDYKITIYSRILGNETSEEGGFFDFLFGGNEESLQGTTTTLISGEKAEINFDIINFNQTFNIVELSTENLTYQIPVYILAKEEQEEKEKRFNLEPSYLNITLPTNSNTTRIIYLYNTGEDTLKNISLSVSNSLKPYINLSIENIEELESNDSVKFNLYIFSEEEAEIEGHIKAITEDETLLTYSEISLDFLRDYVPEDEPFATKTCLEWNGTICDEDEECDEDPVTTKDAVCCLGNCKKIKKSPVGAIIGWAIVILVISFLAWFFLTKYRKAQRPVDLLGIAEKRKPSFKNYNLKNERIIRKPIKIMRRPPVKIVEKPIIREVEKKVFIEKPKKSLPKYTGSLNTKTYHKTSCKFSKLIEDKYKVMKDDIEYFQKQGYKPCKVCLR